jgi:hypothetical protein
MKKSIQYFASILLVILSLAIMAKPCNAKNNISTDNLSIKPKQICITIDCCYINILGIEIGTNVFHGVICFESMGRIGVWDTQATLQPNEGIGWDGNGAIRITNEIVYQDDEGTNFRILPGEYVVENLKARLKISEE